MRDPAWSPDGKRLAVVVLDRIWTMQPDGREGTELTRILAVEREPAWSPDGKRIAFAADRGKGFDLYVVNVPGAQSRQAAQGVPEPVAVLEGDERWPSWTPEGRLVFAHRASDTTQWDLFEIDPGVSIDKRIPLRLTQSLDDEVQPRVSPDGRRIAFASNRGNDEGDFDIWLMRLFDKSTPDETGGRGPAIRFARLAGYEGHPAWSPDGDRLAYYAVRDGLGSTWVAGIAPWNDGGAGPSRPVAPPVLASRHGGTIAWSPDGQTLAIGEIPEPEPSYNGNPQRDASDPPALFGLGRAYQLWTVPAPRLVDEGGRSVGPPGGAPSQAALTRAFDSVWSTLKRMYYDSGSGSLLWEAPSRRVSSARGAGPHAGRARGRRRSDGGAAAAGQAQRDLVARRRRVGASARIPGRSRGPRTWRQHRRCGDCRVVRAGCRRARRVGHRRRRSGGAVSQGHGGAHRHRVQGSDAARRDARCAGPPPQRAAASRRSDVGQHPGRRRRSRFPLHEVRKRTRELGRPRRARRSGTRRRDSSSTPRCRRAWPKGGSRSRSTPARRESSCPTGGCRGRASGSSIATTAPRCGRSRARAPRRSIAVRSRSALPRTCWSMAGFSPSPTSPSIERSSESPCRAAIEVTCCTREDRRSAPACRSSKRCRSSPTTGRSRGPRSLAMPTTGTI